MTCRRAQIVGERPSAELVPDWVGCDALWASKLALRWLMAQLVDVLELSRLDCAPISPGPRAAVIVCCEIVRGQCVLESFEIIGTRPGTLVGIRRVIYSVSRISHFILTETWLFPPWSAVGSMSSTRQRA